MFWRFVCLFICKTETEKETFSTYWLTPQISTTDRATPGQSGTRSAMRMVRAPALGSPFAASQAHSQEAIQEWKSWDLNQYSREECGYPMHWLSQQHKTDSLSCVFYQTFVCLLTFFVAQALTWYTFSQGELLSSEKEHKEPWSLHYNEHHAGDSGLHWGICKLKGNKPKLLKLTKACYNIGRETCTEKKKIRLLKNISKK